MKEDHYSVLGVTPTSEDVVIRAAYRALMRRYHPDADPSSEAAERARAINAAYAVLSDPEKRARYDGSLAAHGLIRFEPVPPEEPARSLRSRLAPVTAIGFTVMAAAMVAFAVSPPMGQLPVPVLPLGGDSQPVADDAQPAPGVQPAGTSPGETAQGRSARSLATQAPAPREPDAAKVLEPRQVAAADVGVTVDAPPTADIALAEPAPSKLKKAPVAAAPIKPESTPADAQPNRESSNCAGARSRPERLICTNSNLSSLDRQLVLLYRQSWRQADEKKRAALLGTRQSFNDRREACGSPNCLTTAYVTRLKEISDIMAGRSGQ